MTGITPRSPDRRKNWGDEGSRPVLLGKSFEATRDGNLEDWSEELEDSEIGGKFTGISGWI